MQGLAFSQRLNYVAGLYYSSETEQQILGTTFFDIIFGGESQINAFSITHKTAAPYAQGTYQLNDNGLSGTLGVRYTSERVGFDQLPEDSTRTALGATPPAGISYVQSSTYDNVSWNIGLQLQVDPDWLVYFASRRAFKSGGYNGTVPPVVGYGETGGNAFREERVTDVEIGSKFPLDRFGWQAGGRNDRLVDRFGGKQAVCSQ